MSKYSTLLVTLLIGSGLAQAEEPADAARTAKAITSDVISLDGGDWLLATDPKNEGRQQNWCFEPRPDARPTKVPWIIQDAFPGYHGVAWYWRKFDATANPHAGGRYLLRFWAVDYLAEVWLNGTRVGQHEGGESSFVLDVTEAVKPGESNLLAVRVLNPTHEAIDGVVLNETPHRNKALPYRSGSAWNQGGIMDSVELLIVPALRIDDLFVRSDWKTGKIHVRAQVFCVRGETTASRIEFSVSPAANGKTLDCRILTVTLATGETTVETELDVGEPHLWNLNDPFLYRVSARVHAEGSGSIDEQSVRCGFCEFRFADGYFRLNGRRIYLRSSHTGNCCPIGLELPHDPDLLRRDLLNVKAMGFNMIRFIAGVAKWYQLDLCDEIGLMVYDESYASWCLADSVHMPRRYDESVLGMIRRDRNHPSVVVWGLLNETPEGPVFRRAVGLLGEVRKLDDSRLVMLNSGRWDQHGGGGVTGIEAWQNKDRVDPCVTHNGTAHTVRGLGITWAPGQLAFHPGRDGEYSVVRWKSPVEGTVKLAARMRSIAEEATTDVHVLHNGRPLFDSFINLHDCGAQAEFAKSIKVKAGDTIDCAVGFGNGSYGADTTALAIRITMPTARPVTPRPTSPSKPTPTAPGVAASSLRHRSLMQPRSGRIRRRSSSRTSGR